MTRATHRIFFGILGLVASNQTWAQRPDYLTPVEGYFSSFNYADRYYPKVRTALLDSLSDSPLARVVVIPSFSPEYVVSIDEKNARYYLTYRIGQQSIWYSLARNSVHQVAVTTRVAELKPDFAKALGNLFNTALLQTRYPPTAAGIGFDGTTYIVITFQLGTGLKSGQVWSPESTTNLGALVSIVESLPKIAETPSSDRLQDKLLTQIRLLIQRISKL